MSASGTGPFENDFAMDLCDDLRSLRGGDVVELLRGVLAEASEVPSGDYLDRDLGEPAVAASAIILAKFEDGRVELENAGLLDVIPELPSDLISLAVSALGRTLETDSEVRGLWFDSGRGEEWESGVDRLLRAAETLARRGI
ncbi:DUF4259 domain-containing protein [Streptomyces sp. NPDC047024]|uniref:DUF4259 domain-containing protein n=1 Tax=Streptomyces sp. NPDC047024 TaxID=3155476 RepID=UPI0033F5E7D0